MKNTFWMICLLALVGLSGCFEANDNTYNGPNLVEFTTASQNVTVSGNPVALEIRVQLVREQRDTPTTVTYVIDPASTGIEGTDYVFAETKGTLTIPANSSFGFLKLTLNRPAANKTVVFELTGGDLEPNTNYKRFTLGIRR